MNQTPDKNPRTLIMDGTARAILLILFALGCGGSGKSAEVDFQRDVRPILAEHCLVCHGLDAATRKGGLRLDQRAAALIGGRSGTAAIVPGQPEQSRLFQRISSRDTRLVMPPPKQKNPLSDKQIDTLRKWISEGASYQNHWAFTPPVKASLPRVGRTNPVDAFVLARLKGLHLSLSPAAPSGTLYRRLYLDLIGLPPSPQELAACERDGYEATVDRLLRSERFGEKWARHWLDVARYSDTNGYEKDLRREQWAWRDWVIEALNCDMPYDQFLIEQLAGDLLPGAGQAERIATGFLRNSMINEEGAIVPEEFRMVEMFDRMDCLGKAVLGLTTQCAQCHSHKFDPLTQDEYYGMFAFLNNCYEAQSWVYTPEQLRTLASLQARIEAVETRIRAARPKWAQELAAWEQERVRQRVAWEPLIFLELGSISGLNHPTQEADRSLLMIGHPSDDVFMIAEPDLTGVTGLQFEALTHGELPHNGPGRGQAGNWAARELEVFTRKPGAKDWEKVKLVNATADFSQPERREGDKKKATGPVAFLIDGSDDTTWSPARGPGRRNEPSVAVVQFERPLTLPRGTQLKIALRMDTGVGMLGCCRLSITRQRAPTVPPVDHAAMLALQTPAAGRTPEQNAALLAAWRSQVAELKALNEEIDALRKSAPRARTSVLHLREREPAQRRVTHLLKRGLWNQPGKEVEPHVPAALHRWLPERVLANGRQRYALVLMTIVPIQKFTGSRWAPLFRHLSDLDDDLFAFIAARRRGERSPTHANVLDDLLAAAHEDGTPLADQEVRDALFTILIAGHETTALALAFALADIAEHPEVIDRLCDELARVTGGGPPEAGHLSALEYLEGTIRESLRLRPVAPFVVRKAVKPYAVGGRDYPVGVVLCPCSYLVHRREELYPEPERFRPERFLERKFGPYEWFPFGGGNRICLGMPFALYEMKVWLASVLSQVRPSRPEGARSRARRYGIVLGPDEGGRIIVRPRG
jgi:cytochrome P450